MVPVTKEGRKGERRDGIRSEMAEERKGGKKEGRKETKVLPSYKSNS